MPIDLSTILERTFDIAEGCPSDPELFNLCIILDGKRNIEQLIEAFPSFEFTLGHFQKLVDLELVTIIAPTVTPPIAAKCKDSAMFSVECIQKLRKLIIETLCKQCNMMTRIKLQFEVEKALTYGDFNKLKLHMKDENQIAAFDAVLIECCHSVLNN